MFDFLTSITQMNPILHSDSYKGSHFLQYPDGTTYVSSYIESRGGTYNETVFFGLQAFIKEYLLKPITEDDVEMAEQLWTAHGLPFNREGWMKIVINHNGYLPVEIRAVPEGTVMPTRNVQVQVINTDPDMPWLTSFVETALLRAVWYPSTVATVSREMKKRIYQGLLATSDAPDEQLPFKLHDFGARGAAAAESAMLGGMGHLVNFLGTDTFEAIVGANIYYAEDMAGFSIPASEHSTMTAWGRDGEVEAYRNMLKQFPTGLVACVSDSYDVFNAARNIWGGALKDEVMARDGTLVVRPDSGNPTTTPLDVIEILMEKFGYTVNSKGFKVLPDQVRVIQGDGMTEESIPRLINNAIDRGIAVDNFAMGMGGGLLQKIDRDTLKYAMKASAACVNGEWRDVFKDPITDPGKTSKKGKLALVKIDGEYTTVRADQMPQGVHGKARDYLVPVYRNGELLQEYSFAEIRENAAI